MMRRLPTSRNQQTIGWNSSNPYPELDFIHFSPHSPRECLRELDRAKNKSNNVWELNF
jgi:hypothetical protein